MRLRNLFAITISALLLVAGATSTGAAPEAKEVYIIKFADNANLTNEIAALKAGGGEIRREYKNIFKGAAVALNSAQVTALARNPRIDILEKDSVATTQGSGVQSSPVPVWGLDRIDQRSRTLDKKYSYISDGEYLVGATPTGVKVYVVDTGIRTSHAQFEGRAVWGTNTLDTNDSDCNGHGTHVAGTIGSRDFGVAKKAQLVAVKVLGCDGSGTGTALLSAFDWIAAQESASPNTPRAVVNMSLGFGQRVPSVDLAICRLSTGTTCGSAPTAIAGAKPVVVVVAAGNSNLDACKSSPSSAAANALVVAASDSSDRKASFSNWGSCVDLFAPGVSIVSTWFTSDSVTANLQGTSMASPHVAGMVARLISADPNPTTVSVSTISALLLSQTSNGYISGMSGIAKNTTPNRLLYGTPKP